VHPASTKRAAVEAWAAAVDWSDVDALVLAGLDGDVVEIVRRHTAAPLVCFDPRMSAGVKVSTSAAGLRYELRLLDEAGKKVLIQDGLVPELAHDVRQALACSLARTAIGQAQGHSAEDWEAVLLEALPYWEGASTVGRATRALRALPAVIVGSGPSLDQVADRLPELAPRACIIATPGSVATLERVGVVPDFVAVMDERVPARWLESIAPRSTLLAGLQTAAEVHRLPWRRRLIAPHEVGGAEAVVVEVLEDTLIGVGGSVSTAAMSAAYRLGCSPIILVGMDCAEAPEATHCAGYPDARPHMQTIGQVPGWGGGEPVFTTSSLEIYRQWFEEAAVAIANLRDGPRLVNATGGGAHITGWEELELAELVGELDAWAPSADHLIAKSAPRPITTAELSAIDARLRTKESHV